MASVVISDWYPKSGIWYQVSKPWYFQAWESDNDLRFWDLDLISEYQVQKTWQPDTWQNNTNTVVIRNGVKGTAFYMQ